MAEGGAKEFRALYALGPSNIVASYGQWRTGDEGISQTSLTFSGQLTEAIAKVIDARYARRSPCDPTCRRIR